MKYSSLLFASLIAISAGEAEALFISDNFTTTIGPQWTSYLGQTTDTESLAAVFLVPGMLYVIPPKGAEFSWGVDNALYFEQPAPEGDSWQVVTRLVDFNPAAPGNQLPRNKAGIGIFQDNDHWIAGTFTTEDQSTSTISWYGQAQMDSTSPAGDGIELYRNEFHRKDIAPVLDVLMRVQKTPSGYQIGYSSDNGATWISMTPIMRNPHSDDGSLSGTIRILTSAGHEGGGKTPRPAAFDYVLLQPLDTPAPFANDEFDGTSLDSKWITNGGFPAGELRVSSGSLRMTPGSSTYLSGGSDTTFSPNQNAESGVVASMNVPDSPDFSIYTKVSPTVYNTQSRWRAAGIRLWQNHNSWISITTGRERDEPFAEESRNIIESLFQDEDGQQWHNYQPFTSASSTEPAPGYLRVDRRGSELRVQYSVDGIVWLPGLLGGRTSPDGWMPYQIIPGQKLQVQLYSRRPPTTNGIGEIIESEFDFIRQISSPVNDWQLF